MGDEYPKGYSCSAEGMVESIGSAHLKPTQKLVLLKSRITNLGERQQGGLARPHCSIGIWAITTTSKSGEIMQVHPYWQRNQENV